MSLPDKRLWADLPWADGGPDGEGYRFDISKIKHQRELEAKCDAGIGTIYARLMTNDARLDDYRETIRLGLIGGGMAPDKALKLVQAYVDDRPRQESKKTATLILLTLDLGRSPTATDAVDSEDREDAAAGEPEAPATQEGEQTSPPSTAPELPSGSIPAKSMN